MPTSTAACVLIAKWMLMTPEDGGLGLSGKAAAIYADIMYWSRRPGESYEGSFETLARDAGATVQSARRIVADLEKRGLICAVGERRNSRGKPTTCWAYVPESYYAAAHAFQDHWVAEITKAVRNGDKILDPFGNPIDAKRALMNISADVAAVYDAIDADFDLLWDITLNKNTEVAARSQYRILRDEGYKASEIFQAWKTVQSKLSAAGRTAGKMPNFAKWCTGTASGVPSARTVLDQARNRTVGDDGSRTLPAESRDEVEAMIAEDFEGAKGLAERIDDLQSQANGDAGEMPEELVKLNARFAEVYAEYRLAKREKLRTLLDEGVMANGTAGTDCRGGPV